MDFGRRGGPALGQIAFFFFTSLFLVFSPSPFFALMAALE